MSDHSPQEKRILEAALNVIDRYSISGTRMHLIAEEAGMVASNLHYYFKTKRDLLLALLCELQDTFAQKRNYYVSRSEDTLEGRLAAFFEQKKQLILQEPKYDRAQFDFWVLGQSDLEINRLFQRSYSQWHEHILEVLLHYRPELSEERAHKIARSMISSMMGGSMQYLNGDKFDLDDYFSTSLEMVLALVEAVPGVPVCTLT